MKSVVSVRLQNQHLVGKKFATPEEVVSYFGAVQAQDYPAAKWAVGQRTENGTEEIIEKALTEGKILRIHMMRPTWHFVAPSDIRFIQELTAHRVLSQNKHMHTRLELNETILSKCHEIITHLLKGNNYATREEIGDALEKHGIPARGQKLAYIVMHAELSALICSGPRRGKQFTYALLEERVPKFPKISHDEALAKLAQKYFTSHGPAQLKDFSWWSGLTMKEAQQGIDLIKTKLENEVIDGKTYWYVPTEKISEPKETTALLLSIFDEYTIAYKDRTDISSQRAIESFISMGNALTSVMIIDGKAIGTWKRKLNKNNVEIQLSPFNPLDDGEQKAVQKAAEDYGRFLGLPITVT